MSDRIFLVTLALDPESFSHLDGLRREYFPRERNFLPAHLTLFHRLPEVALIETVLPALERASRRAPLSLAFPSLRFLGFGSAVEVRGPALLELRAALAREWEPLLNPQDRQPWRPHVTVQNKVAAVEAKATFARLSVEWRPRVGRGTGLLLWEYLGGPWRLEREFSFRPEA